MINARIAMYLKQGADTSQIRKRFYEAKLMNICYVHYYYNYCRCLKADFGEIVKKLSGIPDLHGRSIADIDARGTNFISGQEFLLGDKLKYSILLYRISDNRPSFRMSSILTLDNMEFYVNPQSHDSDSFGTKLLQIAAELPQWNAEWLKMNTEILKLRKRINIGSSTIESVLPKILEGLDYPYYTERVAGDTWLYIKLPYHRSIDIKLRPEMDMAILTDIADKIRAVDEALRKMGNIYLKVKNYGNDIKWRK